MYDFRDHPMTSCTDTDISAQTGRFVPETTLVASLAVFVETYRFKLDIYRPFGRHYWISPKVFGAVQCQDLQTVTHVAPNWEKCVSGVIGARVPCQMSENSHDDVQQ